MFRNELPSLEQRAIVLKKELAEKHAEATKLSQEIESEHQTFLEYEEVLLGIEYVQLPELKMNQERAQSKLTEVREDLKNKREMSREQETFSRKLQQKIREQQESGKEQTSRDAELNKALAKLNADFQAVRAPAVRFITQETDTNVIYNKTSESIPIMNRYSSCWNAVVALENLISSQQSKGYSLQRYQKAEEEAEKAKEQTQEIISDLESKVSHLEKTEADATREISQIESKKQSVSRQVEGLREKIKRAQQRQDDLQERIQDLEVELLAVLQKITEAKVGSLMPSRNVRASSIFSNAPPASASSAEAKLTQSEIDAFVALFN